MTQLVLLHRATTSDVLPLTTPPRVVPWRLENPRISIQASVQAPTSVPVSATISIDASNDGKVFKKDVLVFTLSGTGEDTDLDFVDVPYELLRVRVTALSGTGAETFVTARV